jgi:hypothetical protein
LREVKRAGEAVGTNTGGDNVKLDPRRRDEVAQSDGGPLS